MKLASLSNGLPDGELAIVSRDLSRMIKVPAIALTLQQALDRWSDLRPQLETVSDDLNAGKIAGETFHPSDALAPLPRAYQFCDGSVYPAHSRRMSTWRNIPFNEEQLRIPMMYQGASDGFLSATDDIPMLSDDWGLDYEAEVAVILESVKIATPAAESAGKIALIMLCNDVSLRNLIPAELARGFGFVQSKPASAFSVVAITPDELGNTWQDSRVALPMYSYVNGELYGKPDAGAMTHGFDQLIAHAAKTRALAAGTIIGGGTVANDDPDVGTSCLIERRVIEAIRDGEMKTPFLKEGDEVRIEMLDRKGNNLFGTIKQRVRRLS